MNALYSFLTEQTGPKQRLGLCKKVWPPTEEIASGPGFLVYVFKPKMHENVETREGLSTVKLKVWDVYHNEKRS